MNHKSKAAKLLMGLFVAVMTVTCVFLGSVTAYADENSAPKGTPDSPDKQHLLGDVDNNGIVDSYDSLLVLRYSIGLNEIDESLVQYADYDKDGYITSVDALFILRASVGYDYIVRLNLIDVSTWQGKIDWDVTKDYIDGAIIRCGYGGDYTSQDDTYFERNLSECERLGIPVGIYLYSYAKTEAQAYSELEHILRLIKGHSFDMPIFLDVEQSGTEAFAPRACEIICDGLKEAGYIPGVYANTYWWNTYLTSITHYPRWVAQYNNRCTYEGDYVIWQYSSTGKVPGIVGNVDMNYCYINIEDFKYFKY